MGACLDLSCVAHKRLAVLGICMLVLDSLARIRKRVGSCEPKERMKSSPNSRLRLGVTTVAAKTIDHAG